MAAPDPSPELTALLRSREARGLRVPAIGRMFFLGVAQALVLGTRGFAETTVGPGFNAALSGVLALVLAVNVFILVRLRRERGVERLGLLGAALDAALVIALAGFGVVAGLADDLSPAYMLKTELPAAIFVVVAINGLALRARYPAIVGAGAMIAVLLPVGLAALDPATPWSSDRADVYAGSAVDPEGAAGVVLMMAGTVLAVVFAARAARQTVVDGFQKQVDLHRLQQEQLQIVMREKVSTLRKLVAGVCHEVNTPLGAVKSSADTLQRIFGKLESTEGAERLLKIGGQSLETIESAVERLSALEASLRGLSHLDEAEVRDVDLNLALEQVIETARRNLAVQTPVTKDLEPLPSLLLDGTQINQALLTLVTNALEAAGPEGTVTVRSRAEAEHVIVEVRDDGPGITPEALARIFDVSLSERGTRVAVGLGLAAAQNAAHRHDGELTADSEPGNGARFVLRLPRTREPTV